MEPKGPANRNLGIITKVCFSRSPQESSDESGIPFKEDGSETGKEKFPPSPRKINEKILKAQLVAIDRNSIGSCYDNILQKDDGDSEASVEETDIVEDYHDSDDEPCEEEPVKESKPDVIEDLIQGESAEYRARETLKNIPANLVCHFNALVWQLLKEEKVAGIIGQQTTTT